MTETMYVETEVDQYLASPEMAILDIFLSYGGLLCSLKFHSSKFYILWFKIKRKNKDKTLQLVSFILMNAFSLEKVEAKKLGFDPLALKSVSLSVGKASNWSEKRTSCPLLTLSRALCIQDKQGDLI